jgi:hypothetical protein
MSSIIHAFKKRQHLSAAQIGGDLDGTCAVYYPLATMAANEISS